MDELALERARPMLVDVPETKVEAYVDLQWKERESVALVVPNGHAGE